MFNKKLKKRIEELEKEKECLELLLTTVKITLPNGIKDNTYANLVNRIIQQLSMGEYNPLQPKLLYFIINELNIMKKEWES